MNLKHIGCFVVVLLGLAVDDLFSQQDAFKRVAQRFPANTQYMLHCDDFPGLWSRFQETGLFRAFCDTPKIKEWTFLVMEIETFQEEQEKGAVVDSATPLETLIHDLFGGPVTYASLESEGELEWILSVDLNPDNALVNGLIKELAGEGKWGRLSSKPIGDRARWKELLDPDGEFAEDQILCCEFVSEHVYTIPSRQYGIAMTPRRLVVAPNAVILAQWLSWWGEGEVAVEKTLAGNRKFLELVHGVSGAHHQASDVYFYANEAAITKQWIGREAADPKTLAGLRELGVMEVISWGGRLSVATEIADYDMELLVGIGQPKIGMFEVLNLTPLENPVQSSVPSNVDYYFNVNVDAKKMKQFLDASSELPNDLTQILTWDASGLAGVFWRFTNHYPSCFMFSHEGLSQLSGRLDVSGWFDNTLQMPFVREICRTFLKPGGSVIDDYIQTMPGASSLVQKFYGGNAYYGPTDEAIQRSHEKTARLFENLGLDVVDRVPTSSGGWVEFNREIPPYFASFRLEQEELKYVFDPLESTLAESEAVEILWRELSRPQAPGFFVYVRDDAFTKHIFHALASRYFMAAEAPENLEYWKNQGAEGSLEYRLHKQLIDTLPEWSRERIKSHFGSGGLGIYQTDRGYRVRLIQLRK